MNTPNFSNVEDHIRAGLEEHAIPSLAVAVARQGEIVWEAGFGWADCEKRLASTAQIAYPLASVTKPMTATAIMRLVELGKLELDAPANRYLPAECPLKAGVGDADELTVRRLAGHTAGLTTHSNSYAPDDRVPMPPMEESIRRYGHAVVRPGERYRYSNFGYGILDYLVGHVSGLGYAGFMAREVFAPLGMRRSAIGVPKSLADVTATRYDGDGQPLSGFPNNNDHLGASSAYASAHDLLRFGLFHLKQRLPDQQPILRDAAIDAMHAPAVSMGKVPPTDLNLHPGSCYGIGFVVDPDLAPRRVSHGGGMGGSAAKLLLLPDEEIAIAVVSNVFKPLAYTLENEILEVLLPGYRRPDRPAVTPAAPPDPAALAPLRGEWSGRIDTVEGPMNMTLRFLPCGHVHAKVGDLQQKALVNDVRFEDGWLTGRLAGMIETADANRKGRYPIHHLQLDLKLRGDRLTGAVTAIAGATLGHWVELKRG